MKSGRIDGRHARRDSLQIAGVASLMSAVSLAGIARPPSDGTDLPPDLTGREDAAADRFKHREYPRKRLRQAVRLGRWKAHRPGLENPLALQGVEADPRRGRPFPALTRRCRQRHANA